MTQSIDADVILTAAEPLVHQHAPEIQAYGHIIRMPIALSESARKDSVENLNQLLADTITLRDPDKQHRWQVAGHPVTVEGDVGRVDVPLAHAVQSE
jgi:starvation-inducible DNA-binding protein